jgi:hypothetical protein
MSKILSSDLYSYTSMLVKLARTVLAAYRVRKTHPKFLAGVLSSYENVSKALIEKGAYAWRLAYRSRYRQNPGKRIAKYTMEELERLFVEFVQVAEVAEYTAQKIEQGGNSKEARRARKVATALAYQAEQSAKALVQRAIELDMWTQEWGRQIGIRRWLR